MQNMIKVTLDQEQIAAIEQISNNGEIDHRLVDMTPFFEQLRNNRPDVLEGAVNLAIAGVRELVSKIDQLTSLMVSPETPSGYLAKFFKPMEYLINASTNSFDNQESKEFCDVVGKAADEFTRAFITVAKPGMEWFRPVFVKISDSILDRWKKRWDFEMQRYHGLQDSTLN